MKRYLLILLFILIPQSAQGTPDSPMSITPSAVDGAVITSSDENTRNTNISTPYNAHSHSNTDITPIKIADSDGDTQVQTEESSDEDIIRMDTAGTERWTLSAAGERLMATQPYFLVRPSVDQSNMAVGSDVEIVFGTEIFDIGTNFASNTFTAPVTGKYFLATSIGLKQVDSGSSTYNIKITTSNREYQTTITTDQFAGDLGNHSIAVTTYSDMDANDTAIVEFNQASGAQQTDTDDGSSAALITWFTGGLVF